MLIAIATLLIGFRADPVIQVVKTLPYRNGQGKVPLRRIAGTAALFFQSKMSNDVDGSPKAYHPLDDRLALDDIVSAGGKREGGRPDGKLLVQPDSNVVVYQDGKPYIQPSGDARGYYLSMSALSAPSGLPTDPDHFLNAATIPFVVVTGAGVPGVGMGDLAAIYDPATRRTAFCVCGDIGPATETGEASLAAIHALGYPQIKDGRSSPGETRKDILYVFFPGSRKKLFGSGPWPYSAKTIERFARAEFEAWGGSDRVRFVLSH